MTDDKWLVRVRALLAKAEDPAATPAEAEAFTAKATELIAKYGIDQALLAATAPERQVVGDRVIILHPPYARGKCEFAFSIAIALGAHGLRRSKPADPKTVELHLFGFESDLARIEILFTSLLLQAANAQSYAAQRSDEAMTNPRRFKTEFLEGFRAAVRERLTAAERRAAQQAEAERAQTRPEGPGVALALADRTALVERAMAEAYPNQTKGRPRNVRATDAYSQGRHAGQRANLGGTRIDPGRPQALPR